MEKQTKKTILLLSAITLLTSIVYFFTRGIKIINAINLLPRNGKWKKRDVSKITDITIHHGASSQNATIEDYNRWHIEEKGWPSIGYHYVINKDGKVFQTNYLDSLSYHNGYNNTVAIGICLIGNFDNYRVPETQYNSLIWLINYLKKIKKLKSLTRVIGHKEYVRGKTACPGRYFPIEKTRKIVNMKGVDEYKHVSLVSNLFNSSNYNFESADN